jgi:hypothetical protein
MCTIYKTGSCKAIMPFLLELFKNTRIREMEKESAHSVPVETGNMKNSMRRFAFLFFGHYCPKTEYNLTT